MGVRYLPEYQECVQGYLHLTELGDVPGALTPAQVTEYVAEAVAEHSRHRPRLVTDATLDGTGSATAFRLDNLTVPFEEGFSRLTAVEYPTAQTPPAFLALTDDWSVARNTSGQPVLLFVSAPGSGTNNIRLEYTARHALTALASTLNDADFYAVCHLAASYGFLSLAGRGAHALQPSIAASEAGPRTAADVYRSLAKEHRAQYFAHLGIAEKDAGTAAPADARGDWDAASTWGQTDARLFHRSRWS